MKRSFYTIVMLALTAMIFNSCLGSDDDLTYYDDVAIMSFSLSAANQYIVTTSKKGTDSTYVEKVTTSLYKFNIDQLRREIYNPDSLPMNTDAKHIVVSATAKLGGTIYIKSMTSDSVKVFNSSDSIDFSKPRTLIVVSHSGKVRSEYKVMVNIHQEDGDKMSWADMGTAAPVTEYTEGMKAVACGEKIFVFGSDGSQTSGCVVDRNNGKGWKQLTSNIETPFSADAYKSLTAQGERLFLLSDGTIYSSADGETWNSVATTTVNQLLGATAARLYALSAEGKIAFSADGGATWTDDDIDGNAALLPTSNISFCYNPLLTDASANQLLVIGNGDDANAVAGRVWGKVEETTEYSQNVPWTSFGDYDENKYPAPTLAGLCAVAYDGGFVAIGGEGLGKFEAAPFEKVYKSSDGGVLWRTDSKITLPENFSCAGNIFAMTADQDNCIWIVCGQSAKVWRGRLNKLGWEENKMAITE